MVDEQNSQRDSLDFLELITSRTGFSIPDWIGVFYLFDLRILAGFPAATTLSGIFFVTFEPIPIREFLPILTF